MSRSIINTGVVQIFATVLECFAFEHDFEHPLQKFELHPINTAIRRDSSERLLVIKRRKKRKPRSAALPGFLVHLLE